MTGSSGCCASAGIGTPVVFEEAFRSHYDLGRAPRGPENRAAAIHMALSMFDRFEVAADLARRVPKPGRSCGDAGPRPGRGDLRREDGWAGALVRLESASSGHRVCDRRCADRRLSITLRARR